MAKNQEQKTNILADLGLANQSKNDLAMISYNLNNRADDTIKSVITAILEHYSRPELHDSIYTIVKEMALNGTKANIKRIIFADEKIDANNPADYERGMDIFRESLTETWIQKYSQRLTESGYQVTIQFVRSNNRLIIEVVNNTAVTDVEAERIREKLRECMGYESLMDFYVNHADETEGQGLGFSMIIILLKNENLDPHAFTIDLAHSNRTVAKLEIPLIDEELTSRQSWVLKEEKLD